MTGTPHLLPAGSRPLLWAVTVLARVGKGSGRHSAVPTQTLCRLWRVLTKWRGALCGLVAGCQCQHLHWDVPVLFVWTRRPHRVNTSVSERILRDYRSNSGDGCGDAEGRKKFGLRVSVGGHGSPALGRGRAAPVEAGVTEPGRAEVNGAAATESPPPMCCSGHRPPVQVSPLPLSGDRHCAKGSRSCLKWSWDIGLYHTALPATSGAGRGHGCLRAACGNRLERPAGAGGGFGGCLCDRQLCTLTLFI